MPTISQGHQPYHIVLAGRIPFSRWKAFHTPTGYATTNNPVEIYRYTLKLVNGSKRATPTELITLLDLSRIAYVASMVPFTNEQQVPKRLKASYRQEDKKKLIEASTGHRLQIRDLVSISPFTNVTATTHSKKKKNLKRMFLLMTQRHCWLKLVALTKLQTT
ncbi:hypothetical protein JG688_00010525 [Phytophthora aleatoria]|uniref:Uncharacterized protein n=1 Tax=Phytophthora aleatoria TaxID=2496075 RepID=A0A8J5IQ03_9STRA|nr:hypothetical protein JG688_00010525 [Phytophthora aleatoria]